MKEDADGSPAFSTVLYFYDGWQNVEETTSAGVLNKRYVYGSGIDEVLRATLPDAADIDSNPSTTVVDLYYHHNSLGSVMAVTDSAGNVVESYRYRPYGEVTIFNASLTKLSETAVEQPFMFTGRRWDFEEESGLYYYRLRYYDPVEGRFVSRDPLGVWGDPSQLGNAQSYCASNPINRVDPYGDFSPSAEPGISLGDPGSNGAPPSFKGIPLAIPGEWINWWAVKQAWRNGKWDKLLYELGYNSGPNPDAGGGDLLNLILDLLLMAGAAITPGFGDDCLVAGWRAARRAGAGSKGIAGAQGRTTTRKGLVEDLARAKKGEPPRAGPNAGKYAPDRPIPKDPRSGNPLPESEWPHTQLGKKTSKGTRKKGGEPETYTQGREFGKGGKHKEDIHFSDHGRPGPDHPNPHRHKIDPDTGKRHGAEPLDWD